MEFCDIHKSDVLNIRIFKDLPDKRHSGNAKRYATNLYESFPDGTSFVIDKNKYIFARDKNELIHVFSIIMDSDIVENTYKTNKLQILLKDQASKNIRDIQDIIDNNIEIYFIKDRNDLILTFNMHFENKSILDDFGKWVLKKLNTLNPIILNECRLLIRNTKLKYYNSNCVEIKVKEDNNIYHFLRQSTIGSTPGDQLFEFNPIKAFWTKMINTVFEEKVLYDKSVVYSLYTTTDVSIHMFYKISISLFKVLDCNFPCKQIKKKRSIMVSDLEYLKSKFPMKVCLL